MGVVGGGFQEWLGSISWFGYKSCNNEVTIKSRALVVFVEWEDESI